MPNRGLAIEETLALFEELPSNGSDITSGTSNDENMPTVLEDD